MKFYVSIVLNERDDDTVAEAAYYVSEGVVHISGVEHPVSYGDTIISGDVVYKIDNDGCNFHETWSLDRGRVPDDEKLYLLEVNPDTRYAYSLRQYESLHNHVVSRSGRDLRDHGFHENLWNIETDDILSFNADSDTYDDVTNLSGDRFRELLHPVEEIPTEQPVPDGSPEIQIEKIVSGIDGTDGDIGPRGSIGPEGASGSKGDKGDTGEVGPRGSRGDVGSAGDIGQRGLTGEQGPPGQPGSPGSPGPRGEQGLKGDPGDPGETRIVNEQTTDDSIRRDLDSFKAFVERYHNRLNTQLSSLGGGGSDAIMENRDVGYVPPGNLRDNDALIYDANTKLFEVFPMSKTPLFISNTQPDTTADKYLWIQTGLGNTGNDFTFWFDDGTDC